MTPTYHMTVISLFEFFYFLENLGAKKFTSINKNLNEKFHLVKFTIKCYDPLHFISQKMRFSVNMR